MCARKSARPYVDRIFCICFEASHPTEENSRRTIAPRVWSREHADVKSVRLATRPQAASMSKDGAEFDAPQYFQCAVPRRHVTPVGMCILGVSLTASFHAQYSHSTACRSMTNPFGPSVSQTTALKAPACASRRLYANSKGSSFVRVHSALGYHQHLRIPMAKPNG